jgi:carotenoid cleavage dioxygenase-like enzyme
MAGPANTHVVRHAGRLLAPVESSYPYEITAELDTVGCHEFDGRLRTAMTAHPKTCPTTGELHFFGFSRRAPYLAYHRADAEGRLVVSRPVEVPASTMMHDFSMTAEHVVFLDLPVVATPARASTTAGPACPPGTATSPPPAAAPTAGTARSPATTCAPVRASATSSTAAGCPARRRSSPPTAPPTDPAGW